MLAMLLRTLRHTCRGLWFLNKLINKEQHVPRAIELDEKGRTILTDGIAFGPPAPRLQIFDLKMGDVLVWYSSESSRITAAIQEFSRGPYSHSGIYIGNGESVDAGPQGVAEVKVADLMANFDYARVMRKKSLNGHQQLAVVKAAHSFVGRGYAWFDAIALPARRRAYYQRYSPKRKFDLVALLGRGLTALRRRHPPSSKKTFCSRMVIEAYAAIGHFPQEHCIECAHTPYDLAAETFFHEEGWLSNSATPTWHRLDPYSPKSVSLRKWSFSPSRIIRGK